MKKRCIPILLSVFISFIASGCGSGGGGAGGGAGSNGSGNGGGVLQKGPFVRGSEIVFWELDDNLDRTGASHSTKTENDSGFYIPPNFIKSKYVDIVATGIYFNEVSDTLSRFAISLTAVCDLTLNDTPNVNILTTIASERIKFLVKNKGLSFEEAMHRAEAEILYAFGILNSVPAYFYEMDLNEGGMSNAVLLLLSSFLQGDATAIQLSNLINDISKDQVSHLD